jgi:hypothetical protein
MAALAQVDSFFTPHVCRLDVRLLGRAFIAAVVFTLGPGAPARALSLCREVRAARIAACMRSKCPEARGARRRACRHDCTPARIRTLAYVLAQCRQLDPGTITAGGNLVLQRGDCEPIMLLPFISFGVVRDPIGGACTYLAENRFGALSTVGGALQRLGVSPDGRRVVFELNDQVSFFAPGGLAPGAQRHVSRADRRRLRRADRSTER